MNAKAAANLRIGDPRKVAIKVNSSWEAGNR
jgi:hypothetical protein